MKSLLVQSLVIGAMLMCPLLTPRARADEWDRKTIVTFSAPVEIPGKVLPAGTYVFKLMDSPSNRNIVQIFNKDENKLYATILAIPDYHMEPTGKTVITFEERPTGTPEAIRAWFYPGDNYGEEFVYPHKRAMELAQRSGQHVLTASATATNESQSTAAMKKAQVTAIQPSGQEVELAQVHPPAAAKAAPPAQVTNPAPVNTASAATPTMPHTASQWLLDLILGFAALGGAFALRRYSSSTVS